MKRKIFHLLYCLSFILLTQIAGCKVQIDVPPVGRVITQSGSIACEAGHQCVINVETANFDETFVAESKAGYEFSHWKKKSGYFCGNGIKVCRLSSKGFEKFPILMSLLDSDQTFFLEPVYTPAIKPGKASIAGFIEEGTVLLVDNFGYIQNSYIAFGSVSEKIYVDGRSLDAYRFTFSQLPTNKNFRLYWISDGQIWTLFGDDNRNGIPNSNVFVFTDGYDIDLGLVSHRKPIEGGIFSQYDIFDQPGIVPGTKKIGIPLNLEFPSFRGFDNKELLRRGMGAIFSGWMGGANTYLDRVVSSTKPRSTNQADSARFFYALSKLASMPFESASDRSASDINRFSDILDLIGIPNDYRRGSLAWIDAPDEITLNTDSSERMQSYLDERIRGDLNFAARLINQVSSNFRISWVRPDNNTNVENDYGDAIFFLALLKLQQSQIELWNAYNLDANIADPLESLSDDNPSNDATIENFLDDNPKFLSIKDQSALKKSGDLFLGAINSLEIAIENIQSETDSQNDDVVRLTSIDSEDVTRTRDYLKKIRLSLTTGRTVIDIDESGDRQKDLILDLERFFTVGVDFRNDGVLPNIVGNELHDSKPCLPDPSFNGVVISPNFEEVIFDRFRCE